MKKIVFIGPNAGMGGVERASTNMSNGLMEIGCDVTYLALIPENPFFKLNTKYIEPIDFNLQSMDFLVTVKAMDSLYAKVGIFVMPSIS